MKGLGAAAASAAVIMLSGAGGAYAADLAVKAPVYKAPVSDTCTSILDFFTTACQVAAYGVRFYGTIDAGVSYQTNGAPADRTSGSGLTYTPQKMNNGAKWLPASNGMQPSVIGLQVKEPVGDGWSFVGQVETAFDSETLGILNGSHALRDDVGSVLGNAKGVADSSGQGKFYNSYLYAGFSNNTWGTLTFGRQRSPYGEVVQSFDPAGGSYAFGLIGGNGSLSNGGDTETSRGTTALKYKVNFANYTFAAFAQLGGYNEGNPSKGAYAASLAADYRIGPGLLSLASAGGYTKDALSESLKTPLLASGLGDPNLPITGITATITDNVYATVAVKYTLDRLKLYAGYLWTQFANPSDFTSSLTDTAGYDFPSGTFTITNGGLPVDKVWQEAWAGARYSLTDSVDVYGGYYHFSQNDYSNGNSFTDAGLKQTCASNGLASSQCAGVQQAVTAVIDWKFAPKWDTYLGTTYNHLSGGLENGYLHSDFWATTGGVRFRW